MPEPFGEPAAAGSVESVGRRRSRTAVVGLGDISALHLAAIAANPGIELVAVCDTDPERLHAASAFWGVPGFGDHRDLLATIEPDVVHVTTPHDQHVPVALDAIAAGTHVLTEKPVANSVTEAERLLAAARSASVKVGVVLQNRYNPTAIAMREVIASGRLGAIRGARAAVWWTRPPGYYTAAPWRGQWSRSGGGVLINQAIHTIDLLLWLLGEPESVRGVAANLSHPRIEVEDTATISIAHAGGASSTFFATNTHHANDDAELIVDGALGTLRFVGGRVELITAAGNEVLATDAQATGERSYWGKGHELLIADFHARLADPEPFWIDLATAIAPLRVLREVYRQSNLLAGQQF